MRRRRDPRSLPPRRQMCRIDSSWARMLRPFSCICLLLSSLSLCPRVFAANALTSAPSRSQMSVAALSFSSNSSRGLATSLNSSPLLSPTAAAPAPTPTMDLAPGPSAAAPGPIGHLGEVGALVAFRDGITHDPHGILAGWNASLNPNPCSWEGVGCTKAGNVNRISLQRNALFGTISGALLNLPHLTQLDLNHNFLEGSIPPRLGDLPLLYVALSVNQLSGSIPASFGRPGLKTLLLEYNALTGPVPDSIWQNATSLQTLLLTGNRLTGSLPPTLVPMANLAHISTAFNSLSGSIPPDMGSLRHLKSIDFSHNNFSGAVPTVFGQASKLSQLNLSSNQLDGSLPPTFFHRSSTLYALSLGGNKLSGNFPEGISPTLQFLNVSGNKFSGSLPQDLGSSPGLTMLDLHDNNFSGSLPSFSGSNSLVSLDLSANPGLNSFFPSGLADLPRLQTLKLSSAGLRGPLPASAGVLPFLRTLDLAHNFLNASVPPALSRLLLTPGIPQLAGNCLEASSTANCTSFDNGICFLPHQRPPYECVPPLPSDQLDRHVVTTAVILGVVVLCVVGACLGGLGGLLLLCCRPGKAVRIPLVSVDVRKGGPITGIRVITSEESRTGGSDVEGVPRFTFAELATATRNFEQRVGGDTYCGVLAGGMAVAVKVLKPASVLPAAQLYAHLRVIHAVRHPHLVEVVGYCAEGGSQMVLHPLAEQGALFNHLHEGGIPLSWRERLRVAVGAAAGLEVLHSSTPPLCHGDVKSANVLLTADLAAKLSDFGMESEAFQAVRGAGERLQSHTEARGSFGYVDPQSLADPRPSPPSDVYSFGVLLLEVITGRLALDADSCTLLVWVQDYLQSRETVGKMLDPLLAEGGGVPMQELEGVVAIIQSCTKVRERVDRVGRMGQKRGEAGCSGGGGECVQAQKSARPTMREVTAALVERCNISRQEALPRC